MISVCIIRSLNKPWHNNTTDAFYKALNFDEDKKFKVKKLYTYPEHHEFFDFIIVIGIKALSKKIFDGSILKKQCNFLIDLGDHSMDARTDCEDYYFYFLKNNSKLKDNYIYIPKFVDESLLIPNQENNILTVFIDHYRHQQEKERELSIRAISEIFKILKYSNVNLNIFYHNSSGIVLNPSTFEIPEIGFKENYKFIPYKQIIEYYKKTHIFFPTHRETQGMVAHEIGACGGLTIMQNWMYPETTHKDFYHIKYKFGSKLDFKKISEYVFNLKNREMFREKVLNNCSFLNFKTVLKKTLTTIYNDKQKKN